MKLKRLLIGIFALIFLVKAYTQSNDKISWGLSFTPKVNMVIFDDKDLGRNDTQFGLNIQTSIIYQLNKKLYLESGLLYSLDRLDIVDYTPRLACDFIEGVGYDLYNSWYEDKLDIHYLGLPLQLKYYPSSQSDRFFMRFGMTHLIKISQSGSSILSECGINELELDENIAKKPLSVTNKLSLGFGFEIDSGANTKLMLEPEIAYQPVEIFDDPGFRDPTLNNLRFIDLGLRIGVVFK